MEDFVYAPHSQEVDAQNSKKENNGQTNTHIALKCKRVFARLWPTE
jgi:hypothetical protein